MVNQIQTAFEKIVDFTIFSSQDSIEAYVNRLRSQYPLMSNYELSRLIVNRKSFKNGIIGAVTGICPLLTLPISLPADLISTLRIQAAMALSIAYVYGHTSATTDLKTDVYLIIAGNSVKEFFKDLGVQTSKEITKKAVQKYITRDLMKKIGKYISRKILSKAGEKSLVSFMKMVPLIGIPVGFIFDWSAAQTVGYSAMKYYSNR